MRILVVENETALNKTVTEGLSELGYQTDDAESIKDAMYFISIRNYDLIIINWLMDGGDVRELIEAIKKKSNRTAVILLAGNTGKEDEIEGLRAGADDYIRKPFDFDVLVARIEARLRFGGTSIIEIEDLVIDPDEEKITFKGVEIELK
ncbi:MAG TPA: response regulator, partial [Campylobacterales bacterium]|nr:response regulator [Campylobacterales bacterium]